MKFSGGKKGMGLYRFGLVVLIALTLFCPLKAYADNLVSGRYLKGEGQKIEIELELLIG